MQPKSRNLYRKLWVPIDYLLENGTRGIIVIYKKLMYRDCYLSYNNDKKRNILLICDWEHNFKKVQFLFSDFQYSTTKNTLGYKVGDIFRIF